MNIHKSIRMLCLPALLVVLSIWSAAAYAQAETCEIDVSGAVLQLLDAQTLAAGGDTEAGLARIAETRAVLAALVESCGAAGIEASALLDNEFVAPNGSFVVSYPEGWIEGAFAPNPGGGGVFFGSSLAAATALNNPNPQLQPGEQALAIAVGTPALLGSDAESPAFEDVVRAFAEGSMAQFEVVSELEVSSLEDRPVGIAQYRGAAFEALLVGIQVPESDLYAAVVGVAARGELDALRPIIEAAALSVR